MCFCDVGNVDPLVIKYYIELLVVTRNPFGIKELDGMVGIGGRVYSASLEEMRLGKTLSL